MSTENSQNTTAVEEKQQPVDQELEKMRREAQNLDALATQLQSQKRFAEAFDFYNKSRNVYQKIGDKEAAAQQLTHMAYLKELLGEFEASLGHYQESKELFRETNNKEDFAEVTDRIAKTFYREKKYEEAIKEYTDAIEFGCQGGDLFNNTGFIYITLNKIKEALPYLEKAREIRAAEESEFLDISINNLGTARIPGRQIRRGHAPFFSRPWKPIREKQRKTEPYSSSSLPWGRKRTPGRRLLNAIMM